MKGPASLPTREVGGNLTNMHPEFYLEVNLVWISVPQRVQRGGGCVAKLDGQGGLPHGCGSTD